MHCLFHLCVCREDHPSERPWRQAERELCEGRGEIIYVFSGTFERVTCFVCIVLLVTNKKDCKGEKINGFVMGTYTL